MVDGTNGLTYLETSLEYLPKVQEVALSNFAELTHSYTLSEETIDDRYFADKGSFMGPILAASDGQRSFLLAYEHGSTVPDAFLHYQLGPNRSVRLVAVKGNYGSGQTIDTNHPYQTIWMETAAVRGDIDELASSCRRFILKFLPQNLGTREPYIFYNTWNFQERDRWRNGKSYLQTMNEDRILKEIDVAHRLGVDVFVLDTGWYEISSTTGRGAVVIFATEPGTYRYIASHKVTIAPDDAGRVRIEATFDEPGAKILLFGVS